MNSHSPLPSLKREPPTDLRNYFKSSSNNSFDNNYQFFPQEQQFIDIPQHSQPVDPQNNDTNPGINSIVQAINNKIPLTIQITKTFFTSIAKSSNLSSKFIKTLDAKKDIIINALTMLDAMKFNVKNISSMLHGVCSKIGDAINTLGNNATQLRNLGFDAKSISSMLSGAGSKIGDAINALVNNADRLRNLGFDAKSISSMLSGAGSKIGDAINALVNDANQLQNLGFDAKSISSMLSGAGSKIGDAINALVNNANRLRNLGFDAKSISSMLSGAGSKIADAINVISVGWNRLSIILIHMLSLTNTEQRQQKLSEFNVQQIISDYHSCRLKNILLNFQNKVQYMSNNYVKYQNTINKMLNKLPPLPTNEASQFVGTDFIGACDVLNQDIFAGFNFNEGDFNFNEGDFNFNEGDFNFNEGDLSLDEGYLSLNEGYLNLDGIYKLNNDSK